MKMYLLSLAVGLLVGVLYYVLNVKSPAPPLVALVGLLGMVIESNCFLYQILFLIRFIQKAKWCHVI